MRGGGAVRRLPVRGFLRACALGLIGVLALLGCPGVAVSATTATTTFKSPGQYSFTVPVGVTSITVAAVGATGGGCEGVGGGHGAQVTASVPVSAGEPLFVGVGGIGETCHQPSGGAGGIGGGGNGAAGNHHDGGAGGGGASALGQASASPGFPGLLVVAAGGGGAGGPSAFTGGGGNAGSPGSGAPGGGGGPGTSTAGGSGGQPGGGSGSFGLGGTGGNCGNDFTSSGGGGGGGYYGGGGGGGCGGSGGGGGSSFVAPAATVVSAPTPSTAPSGVSITYAAPIADESTTSMHFGTQAPGTAGASQTLTVKNNGSAPLVVSGVLLGGPDPGDFLMFDRCQQPVAVGSSCEIGVRFAPQVSGGRSATLTLLTNAANASPSVALTGGTTVGRPGLAGKVELLTCKSTGDRALQRGRGAAPVGEACREKVIRGTVKFTVAGASTRAKLVRGAKIFATGAEVATPQGGSELVLTERRRVKPGTYGLILRHRHDHRWITHRLRIALRR